MAGVTLLTSMCTAFGPYVCNSACVFVCVYIYMLCKYEPRYGYMSACIPISIDFPIRSLLHSSVFYFSKLTTFILPALLQPHTAVQV